MRFLRFTRPDDDTKVFVNASVIECVYVDEGVTCIATADAIYTVREDINEVMDAIMSFELSKESGSCPGS